MEVIPHQPSTADARVNSEYGVQGISPDTSDTRDGGAHANLLIEFLDEGHHARPCTHTYSTTEDRSISKYRSIATGYW